MKDQFENPSKYQPKELFDELTKYALLVCNQYYNKDYTTLGNIPTVENDFKNAKKKVKMMGILP